MTLNFDHSLQIIMLTNLTSTIGSNKHLLFIYYLLNSFIYIYIYIYIYTIHTCICVCMCVEKFVKQTFCLLFNCYILVILLYDINLRRTAAISLFESSSALLRSDTYIHI